MFEAVAELVSATATKRCVVAIIDDIHAADIPSLLLLRFLGGGLSESRVVLVVLGRDPVLDSAEPEQQHLAELTRMARDRHLRPPPLTDLETAELVEATVGHQATPQVLRAIVAQTEGNPLFVAETSRLLVDEGRLDLADPNTRTTIPDSVKAVISTRLYRLSPSCRATLQLASVIGREFSLELLAGLGVPVAEGSRRSTKRRAPASCTRAAAAWAAGGSRTS